MYHYTSPPPHGWSAYDYTTSPPPSPHYQSFYVASPYATPSPRGTSKRHSRKTSFATPRESGLNSAYTAYYERVPEYASPRKHDPVSAFSAKKKRNHRASMPGELHATGFRFGYDNARPSRTPKRPIILDPVDDADDEPAYVYYREPRSVRFDRRHSSATQGKPRPTTDHAAFFSQAPPIYEEETVRRSRARRASTSTSTKTAPPRPKPVPPPSKPTRQATEEDAREAGIPPGYSIKNWDPTEAPILLLGSAFDANSLGKWIYDWTVYHHGAPTPITEIAGDLWLLLIKLAGKIKRADEFLVRHPHHAHEDLLNDFLASGERLWMRFKELLKKCEHYMWKAAKRDSSNGSRVSMGRNAGCEFVESMFGRDRKLHDTETLMNGIRLWNMRFDANCEEIIRPSRSSSRRQSTV